MQATVHVHLEGHPVRLEPTAPEVELQPHSICQSLTALENGEAP